MSNVNQIEVKKLEVLNVFKEWFVIPEYQRPYVWKKEQVRELLDDIQDAMIDNKESQYFLGSVVLKKEPKTIEDITYDEYELLDGQQRVTTLFLIFAVIRDFALRDAKENPTAIQTARNAIRQEANAFERIPQRYRIVFNIREEVKKTIEEYVLSDSATEKVDDIVCEDINDDVSVTNIINALKAIREFFTYNDYLSFLKFLNTNVVMIMVSTNNLEDSFRLFKVLNSRGITLRNSDILKTINLAVINDKKTRTKYAKIWEETENYFGEYFDDFISYLRTILVQQKASLSLLKEFELNIYAPKNNKPLLNKGEETFKFIERYQQHYELLFDDKDSFGPEFSNYLYIMETGFESDYWIAALLKYYDKFKKSQLLDFLKALDRKFAGDWIVGNTLTVRIGNVNNILKTIDSSKTTEQILKSKYFAVDRTLREVLSQNIYGKSSSKYLLLKLDMLYGNREISMKIPKTISIEHILPQNPNEDSKWVKDFTPKQRNDYLHKLGNLVLISRRKNTSQGNKDYAEKKKKYFEKNIEIFPLSQAVLNNFETWTPHDFKKHQRDVLAKLYKEFHIE